MRYRYAAILLLLVSCTSISRKPAADFPPGAIPSQETWAYSWTDHKATAGELIDYALKNAQTCLNQNVQPPPANCQNFAGPGFYTCDNPFTSHDYGSIVVGVRTRAGAPIGDGTSRDNYGPAGGVYSDFYSDKSFSGIIYVFRQKLAVVFRDDRALNLDTAYSLDLSQVAYKTFKDHDANLKCDRSTAPNSILMAWSDHLEFMSEAFELGRNTSQPGLTQNGKLDAIGKAAAAMSDALAMSNQRLTALLDKLMAMNAVKESMSESNCAMTDSRSPRACLYRRLVDSLRNNTQEYREQKRSLDFPALKWVLGTMEVLPAQELKAITKLDQLNRHLARKLSPQAETAALAAIDCARVFHEFSGEHEYMRWTP